MALTKTSGRQPVLSATIPFTFEDFTSGVAVEAIDLPGGAYIVGGEVVITTAFNTSSSDALEVGDSSAVNALKSSFSVQSTGITALVPYQGSIATKDAVTLELTSVGTAATAGAGFLRVSYVIDGRATDVQP